MAYSFNNIEREESSGDNLGYGYFNPNPRGSITGDCVKRAIVVATGKDYHELEVMMNRTKVKKSEPYNYKPNYENTIKLLGGTKIKMSVPKGTNRWHVTTIGKVMNKYPHVNYVLAVSKHLIGVRDKTIYDLYDDRPRDKGIYIMYIFGATAKEARDIQLACSKGNGEREYEL